MRQSGLSCQQIKETIIIISKILPFPFDSPLIFIRILIAELFIEGYPPRIHRLFLFLHL